jgi:hypothetical protein
LVGLPFLLLSKEPRQQCPRTTESILDKTKGANY